MQPLEIAKRFSMELLVEFEYNFKSTQTLSETPETVHTCEIFTKIRWGCQLYFINCDLHLIF